jgi:hypothetical protein
LTTYRSIVPERLQECDEERDDYADDDGEEKPVSTQSQK